MQLLNTHRGFVMSLSNAVVMISIVVLKLVFPEVSNGISHIAPLRSQYIKLWPCCKNKFITKRCKNNQTVQGIKINSGDGTAACLSSCNVPFILDNTQIGLSTLFNGTISLLLKCSKNNCWQWGQGIIQCTEERPGEFSGCGFSSFKRLEITLAHLH